MSNRTFNHLTVEEREQIQLALWAKRSIRSIAEALGRSPSSISRELKKNLSLRNIYIPRAANRRALEKRKSRGRKERLKNLFIRTYVVTKLKDDYSPEQIAGRLKRDYPQYSISHEAIYRYVYSQIHRDGWGLLKPQCEDLRIYLPRRYKRRSCHGGRRVQRLSLPSRISIENRPSYINLRKQQGHWEGDSIVSRQSNDGLNTLVERVTGLVFITKIKDRTSGETARAVISRLTLIPERLRLTLTVDNGTENFAHTYITEELKTSVYFAHTYCSQERGTNENTNGLIRRYLPKKTDFATVSDETVRFIEQKLNNRPRKRLGYRTPLEVFNRGVALTG